MKFFQKLKDFFKKPDQLPEFTARLLFRPNPRGGRRGVYSKERGAKILATKAARNFDNSGPLNPFFGKKHTPENIEKFRLNRLKQDFKKTGFAGKKHKKESYAKISKRVADELAAEQKSKWQI